MAIPEPLELGHNSVAIAIDKGKNSQSAVQWTVDQFLKGSKDFTVVLVHVKTHNYHSQTNYGPTGSTPSDSEVKQLFLPYRGYCGRKGISAYEVVLHDIDVASALISYIAEHSIGNIVVGASNLNAFTRRFRPQDVPTSLEKSAPDFCTVYVIYKGKIHSMRASNICQVPSSNLNAKTTRSNKSGSSKSSYSNGTDNQSNTSGHSSSRSQGSSRSKGMGQSNSPYRSTRNDNNATRAQGTGRPTSPYNNPASPYNNPASPYNNRIGSPYNNPIGTPYNNPIGSPYNNTKEDNSYRFQGMEQPTTRAHNANNFDNPSRSPDKGQTSKHRHSSSFENSLRLQNMGQPPTHPHNNNSFDNTPRNHNRQGSGGKPSENNEPRSRTLSRSQSFASDELDDEMRQLKLEVKQTMELYHTICKQSATAKQHDELLQSIGNEDSIENIKLAREGAMIVAELERQKCQAALNAAQMTERLIEMETRKRKIVEERAAKQEENGQRTRSSSQVSHREYTFKEIEVATNNFSDTLKIGEGGYGPVYRAVLQHTPVAIKVLRPDASQGLKQFQQEIEVLGRIRHPNMVLLLGACTEYGCLVYEYMENGSLEDRLFCRNNTPPIPWKTRFKIAAEIGSALLFLHEAKPEPMVHRDLKPANILLDGNYTSKIADVGLARLVPPAVANQITQYHMTAAAGTFCYIDPEYQQTGKLGTKSDVYSLGIMLLQLITARPPMALSYHVEEAIDEGTFREMLDPLIPDWPVEEALSLAKLALKCSQIRKKDRPHLDSVVLPDLIRLRDFAFKS
uniref:RING-type E3 ubiquitin transferase n=3 Tax=Chenopodium quinoa TaxID=63459 RepID=A0A803KR57_CHEQI